MIPPQGHITVKVDLQQKDETTIGGSNIKTGRNYNENFRERNPVIAEVVDGLGEIKTGCFIVCNYNYFDTDSPLQITDNIFAIPVNEEIFAIVREDGTLKPVCGNILVERVTKETKIELPEELKKPHTNQGIVSVNSEGYFNGQYIFWLQMADYEIVYQWKGVEHRAIKVHKSEIVGYLKKSVILTH